MPADCPEDYPFIEINGSCSETCASRIFREIHINASDKSAYVCVSECDYYVIKSVVSGTKMSKCVPKISCPAPTPLLVADSLACVAKCPRTTFLLMEARICLTQCPYFHYYNDMTWGSVCLQTCSFPYGQEGSVTRNHTLCVSQCTDYAYSGECTPLCSGYLADVSCYDTCPNKQKYINANSECSIYCPVYAI